MNILIIHNEYLTQGGEEQAVATESKLLQSSGDRVSVLKYTNERTSRFDPVLTQVNFAYQCIWSSSSSRDTVDEVDRLRPDLVHVHNFFPTASPSIYSAARSQGAAVVQTLHNYRLLCPNALFFRDGHVCEDCLGKFVPWPGVRHGCYRDSRAATAVTAAMLTVHRARRTWLKEVDMFIALTEFSRQKFIEGGLPAERIAVKPNFIDRPAQPQRRDDGAFLFVGRLVDYKGVALLPQAWAMLTAPPPLLIAGDGPLRQSLTASTASLPAISLLGAIEATEVEDRMRGARALVLPSLLYENFPMTIVEAFAAGLPVIASNLGAMAEIVEDGRTGLLFAPGDAAALAARVRWAVEHPHEMAQMGINARTEYEAKYTAEINYRQLMEIYERAVEIRQRDRGKGERAKG